MEAVGALMHVEDKAHAMPGAMVVIFPNLPERLPGQIVKAKAAAPVQEMRRRPFYWVLSSK